MSVEFLIGAIDLSPYLVSGYQVTHGLYLAFRPVPKYVMDEIKWMNQWLGRSQISAFHYANGIALSWRLESYKTHSNYVDWFHCMTFEYKTNDGRLIIRMDEQ